MRIRVIPCRVVSIVCRQHREPQLVGKLEDPLAHDILPGDPMVLNFQPVVALAEKAGVPAGRLLGLLVLLP